MSQSSVSQKKLLLFWLPTCSGISYFICTSQRFTLGHSVPPHPPPTLRGRGRTSLLLPRASETPATPLEQGRQTSPRDQCFTVTGFRLICIRAARVVFDRLADRQRPNQLGDMSDCI